MKKLFILITSLMVISSCTTTREVKSSRIEARKEKNYAEQAEIKNAVESKKFIVRFDRLYFSYGGMANLLPRANYMIVDGERAVISAGYLGRQYDIRPITGINIRGKAMNYEVTNESSKGSYEIKMKVSNGINSFEVYLRIGKNGSCNASLSSLKIDNVRYSGKIVPIKEKRAVPLQRQEMI